MSTNEVDNKLEEVAAEWRKQETSARVTRGHSEIITHAQQITHIERVDQDTTKHVRGMLCGSSCLIFGEHIVPLDFDFFTFDHGHKATCTACRAAFKTANNSKVMEEA